MQINRRLLFLLLLVAVILSVVYWFRTEWRRKLSGKNGHFTVAHVYSTYKVKSTRYYHYIYKVDENYYSESATGSNVDYNGDSLKLQFFPVSFYSKDPAIHTVIWSHKFNREIPLGTALDSLNFDRSIVKKYTSFWNGLSPTSKKNNERNIASYQMITGRTLK